MPPANRANAIFELERLRLKLTHIGGLYADVIERSSWNTFLVADDFLTVPSTVTDLVRNGAAAWVQAYRAQFTFLTQAASTLLRNGPRRSKSRSGLAPDGTIHFYIDRYTESSDPVETAIPVADINSVKIIPIKPFTNDNFDLTISSDQTKTLLALVNLENMRLKRDVELNMSWQHGKTKVVVHVA